MDAPPGSEFRSAQRYALLIRTAKIIADGREFLCIIRDASATGLKVRLFSALPQARAIIVELVTGDRYPVELVWQADDHAGLRFLHEIEIEQFLDESRGSFPRRQVRLRIALDAVLHSGGEAVRVVFQDISQQGACVESDKWLLMNELVRLETGVAPPLFAKVRWRSHPRYGLIFEHTFKLDELARISAPLQFAEALQPQVPRESAADAPEDSMPDNPIDGPASKAPGAAEGTILRSL
ncbi:PilZ domain-containing protein [Novosphingobium sp.]|uniref:PilZ domain-containing protein n=1 Tax=Novosphingobium sp. TaxID=1874826 RepID=UPI002619FCC5|nr:PilZ domain-containing protein [Novosphingobium sp.]